MRLFLVRASSLERQREDCNCQDGNPGVSLDDIIANLSLQIARHHELNQTGKKWHQRVANSLVTIDAADERPSQDRCGQSELRHRLAEEDRERALLREAPPIEGCLWRKTTLTSSQAAVDTPRLDQSRGVVSIRNCGMASQDR